MMFGLLAATLLTPDKDFRVLVFSKTAGFRHDSIEVGTAAIKELGKTNGFIVESTEEAATFTKENLDRYRVIVFLNTTGDVLNPDQEKAMEAFFKSGERGYVGIHAAADTEYEWEWYGKLVGGYFLSHPAIQDAKVQVIDRKHPATAHLPEIWNRKDEWYDYKAAPDKTVRILAKLDTTSYQGHKMGENHPTAWCHEFGGGRAFYTGGGHTKESYADPDFQKHLVGAIRWAAGHDK